MAQLLASSMAIAKRGNLRIWRIAPAPLKLQPFWRGFLLKVYKGNRYRRQGI